MHVLRMRCSYKSKGFDALQMAAQQGGPGMGGGKEDGLEAI